MRATVSLLLALGLLVGGASANIAKESLPFELPCPGAGDLVFFLLHGEGRALPVAYESQEISIYANGSVIFQSIKVEHEGTHLCVREQGSDNYYAHPVSLRVRPLPPTDPWGEVYRSQFVTGLLAALVICSIFALSCIVYKKQWRSKTDENDIEPIVRTEGYDNPVMNEDLEAHSTKM